MMWVSGAAHFSPEMCRALGTGEVDAIIRVSYHEECLVERMNGPSPDDVQDPSAPSGAMKVMLDMFTRTLRARVEGKGVRDIKIISPMDGKVLPAPGVLNAPVPQLDQDEEDGHRESATSVVG